jgi:hypothetical protein
LRGLPVAGTAKAKQILKKTGFVILHRGKKNAKRTQFEKTEFRIQESEARRKKLKTKPIWV